MSLLKLNIVKFSKNIVLEVLSSNKRSFLRYRNYCFVFKNGTLEVLPRIPNGSDFYIKFYTSPWDDKTSFGYHGLKLNISHLGDVYTGCIEDAKQYDRMIMFLGKALEYIKYIESLMNIVDKKGENAENELKKYPHLYKKLN